jgi:hypothetical protein
LRRTVDYLQAEFTLLVGGAADPLAAPPSASSRTRADVPS